MRRMWVIRKGVAVHPGGPVELYGHRGFNARFLFNGVDQHAVLGTNWAPLGMDYEITVRVEAVTVTANDRILGGPSEDAFLIAPSSTQVRLRVTDTTGVSEATTTSGSTIIGIEEPITGHVNAERVSMTGLANPGLSIGATLPLKTVFNTIGAHTSGLTNFWHGYIRDLRLTDYSPLQGRFITIGNAARFATLQQQTPEYTEGRVYFDLIRRDTASGTGVWSPLWGSNFTLNLYDEGHGTWPNGIQFGGVALTNVLEDIGQDQQCRVEITFGGGNIECFVDNVSKGVFAGNPTVSILTIGSASGILPMPLNAAMGNVILESGSNIYAWRLDEDSGDTFEAAIGGINGSWSDALGKLNIKENSRHYPMNEGTGNQFNDILAGDVATIQNAGSPGGGWELPQ